ncbi:MAG: lipoprotein signal peptidase [Bacteroidia bacterium]|nr:MAG: lipoprotein signal peptidase [Bacteroidia bacterium]
MNKFRNAVIIIAIILFLDQVLKIWIKTNMFLGDEIKVFGDWFLIHFTENNGMAFGLEFGGVAGKIVLSVFRIFLISIIGRYIYILSKHNAPFGLVLSFAFVFAGALGNIIDSAFYGIIFNDSTFKVAEFLPESGGYEGFLRGKVVDMFYFPIFKGNFPEWFPFWASDEFIFFRPVFNIADTSISIGVLSIIIFHRTYLQDKLIYKKQTVK